MCCQRQWNKYRIYKLQQSNSFSIQCSFTSATSWLPCPRSKNGVRSFLMHKQCPNLACLLKYDFWVHPQLLVFFFFLNTFDWLPFLIGIYQAHSRAFLERITISRALRYKQNFCIASEFWRHEISKNSGL